MNSRPMTENDFNPDVLNDIKNSIDRAEEKGHMSGKQEGLIEGEKRGIIKGRQEGRIEGRQEGRIEGRQEGRIEGRQEGRIEGKQEGRIEEKSSVAKKLLLKGMEIDIIQEIKGLSTEEINRISDEPLPGD